MITPKRKYLCIEIKDGDLYVYTSNISHKHITLSLDDIDNECLVQEGNKNGKYKIPITDFLE